MNRPNLRAQVDEAARLYDEEVRLRERARRIEQDLEVTRFATFERAGALREQRLALLRDAGLL